MTKGARVGSDPAENPQLFPFFPDGSRHGTRFLVVHFAPDSSAATGADGSTAATDVAAEMERLQPGLSHVFEPDSPGMHTTDTVDYGVCVEGELWLQLDDGAAERITPGTVVVQRGTRHAWRNRGDETATMIFVLVGARRD
ncbi:cupin domain-containing protein [Mycolicibacterium sp.]|uniref:cupin domain-containing protein n=1 Tax=Mycolicibacterium sp. TaxID=2320850 RepID=UPI0037CAD798